jgi:hypothetical protein
MSHTDFSVVKVILTPVGKTRVGADQSVRPDRSTRSTSGRYSYTENRDPARTNLWALRHFLALAIYAEELLEASLPNPAFFPDGSERCTTRRFDRGATAHGILLDDRRRG